MSTKSISEEDIWDMNVSQREVELKLHSNSIENEENKINNLLFNQGYLDGTDFIDDVKYHEGFSQGIEKTCHYGAEIGRIDAVLYLNKLKIVGLEKTVEDRLVEVKTRIELNKAVDNEIKSEIDGILKTFQSFN